MYAHFLWFHFWIGSAVKWKFRKCYTNENSHNVILKDLLWKKNQSTNGLEVERLFGKCKYAKSRLPSLIFESIKILVSLCSTYRQRNYIEHKSGHTIAEVFHSTYHWKRANIFFLQIFKIIMKRKFQEETVAFFLITFYFWKRIKKK